MFYAASPEIRDWNTFYATYVEAAYRFIGAFFVIALVLYVLSGLVSGLLVGVKAAEWKQYPLTIARGTGPILIIAAAALLPIYAMFHPFTPGSVETSAGVVPLGLIVLLLALFAWSEPVVRHWHPKRAWNDVRAVWKSWGWYLGSIVSVLTAGFFLWIFALTTPRARFVLSYVVLCVLGVIVTSVSWGQSRRIQVEVIAGSPSGTGKHDKASADYLVARMQTLGLEQNRALRFATNSRAISALNSTDLSASPTGQIGGAIARIAYALRPGLAWHAEVAFVDDGRIAMTLSRNNRLAAADAFSRQDVHLSAIDKTDQESIDRARAQLLTGAAAFLLRELANVYPKLVDGLYGATRWRSIALQVIASSDSLSGGVENRRELLRYATNLDPDNLLAQHSYMQCLVNQYDNPRLDEAAALQLDRLRRHLAPAGKLTNGQEDLALRVSYDSVVNWLVLAKRDPQRLEQHLKRATQSVSTLKDLCTSLAGRPDGELKYTAKVLRIEGECLEKIIAALNTDSETPKVRTQPVSASENLSPTLAYNLACFEAQVLERLADKQEKCDIRELVYFDLAFAASTETSKQCARTDPYLDPVKSDHRFTELVKPTTGFVDLEPYKRFAAKLTEAGFTSAARFAEANTSPWQQAETAKYLNVPVAAVHHMHEVADIGAKCTALALPEMLYLLLELNVDSLDRLRAELDKDRTGFLSSLREKAEQCGLADLESVRKPDRWADAVTS